MWTSVCEREKDKGKEWVCVCAPHGGTGGIIWCPTHGTPRPPAYSPPIFGLSGISHSIVFSLVDIESSLESKGMNFVCTFAYKFKLNTHTSVYQSRWDLLQLVWTVCEFHNAERRAATMKINHVVVTVNLLWIYLQFQGYTWKMKLLRRTSVHVRDAGFKFLIQALLDCQVGSNQLVHVLRQTIGRLSCERN